MCQPREYGLSKRILGGQGMRWFTWLWMIMMWCLRCALTSPSYGLNKGKEGGGRRARTMPRLPLRYYHWQYVWIPLVASGVWFGSILAMLIVYLASGRPRYVSQQGNIAYISDVGASGLKPLFVTACAITGAGFFLSLVAERVLRHTGR